MRSNNRGPTFLFGLSLLVPLIIVGCNVWVKTIDADQTCLGYLKRSADANTVPMALEQLTVARKAMEAKHWTSGYTSVIYKTPDEDVGYWYKNVCESEKELLRAAGNSKMSQLEQSNVLMKLRETLLDGGEKGVAITCPAGIALYPSNKKYAVLVSVALVFAAIGACFIIVSCKDY